MLLLEGVPLRYTGRDRRERGMPYAVPRNTPRNIQHPRCTRTFQCVPRPVKVLEENATYFRHVASRFTLDADEFGDLFYLVCQVIPQIIAEWLKYCKSHRD